jgi:hypothetical protein
VSVTGYWQMALPGMGADVWIQTDNLARRRLGKRLRAEYRHEHPMNPWLSLEPVDDDTDRGDI